LYLSAGNGRQARRTTSATSAGPAELVVPLGEPGPEVPDEAAEGEHRGALVDDRAELELLGRHEPRRPEHPAHVVHAGAAAVGVEVDDLEGAGLEVDDQAAVVEVAGDPAGRGELDVEGDEDVEDAEQPVRRLVCEPLVGRSRSLRASRRTWRGSPSAAS
jgi:hypothetical protein